MSVMNEFQIDLYMKKTSISNTYTAKIRKVYFLDMVIKINNLHSSKTSVANRNINNCKSRKKIL